MSLEENEASISLIDITMKQVRHGHLEGPFVVQDLDALLGKFWITSRRFLVIQGDKLRPVDDLSESFVTAAASVKDKVDLTGVDELASMCKLWTLLRATAGFSVALHSGQVIKGIAVSAADGRFFSDRLVVKCFDLAAAYEQFAVSDIDAAVSVIEVAVPDPSPSWRLFVARALPFGAVGSVIGFNRAAVGFRRCLTRLLGIPVTSYFDYVRLRGDRRLCHQVLR